MRLNKSSILIGICLLIICSSLIYYNNQEKNKNNINDKKVTQPENYDSINVEQFGAVGDGKNDDTEAIQKSINALGNDGGTLLLTPGKTYRITKTINIETDVTIISLGNRRSNIYIDNAESTLPALNVSGKEKYMTTIDSETINTRDHSVKLLKFNNIKSNDLLLIESDTPWYYEPRTGTQNLHKGELHRVSGVTNSEVLIESPLRDSYIAKSENITVKIIEPVTVSIKNISIERSESNKRTIGIKLNYCNNCVIDNVTVKNAIATGIHVVSSYRTSIENSSIEGANDKNSGYGIQTYGSSYSLIRDNKVVGSRRGIDISGRYPDYHTIVEFNIVYGGGKNELGLNYLSEDTQYGIGSHSTANYTVFRNNILGNLNYGINIRSPNVTIEGNHFIGYFKGACIILAVGKNATIKNNDTIARDFIPHFASKYKLPKSIKEFQANSFLYVKSTYTLDSGSINVINNQIKNISKEFIKILIEDVSKKRILNNLTIEENSINYTPNKKNNDIFFINSTSTISIENLKVKLNNIKYEPKISEYRPYNNILY